MYWCDPLGQNQLSLLSYQNSWGGTEDTHEGKKTKYPELAAECREDDWKTIYPVELDGEAVTVYLRVAEVT